MCVNHYSSNITVYLVVKCIIMVSCLEHASQPPILHTSISISRALVHQVNAFITENPIAWLLFSTDSYVEQFIRLTLFIFQCSRKFNAHKHENIIALNAKSSKLSGLREKERLCHLDSFFHCVPYPQMEMHKVATVKSYVPITIITLNVLRKNLFLY